MHSAHANLTHDQYATSSQPTVEESGVDGTSPGPASYRLTSHHATATGHAPPMIAIALKLPAPAGVPNQVFLGGTIQNDRSSPSECVLLFIV
jgi:hypothetical protein